MTPSDIFIQRLAAVLVREVLQDPEELRLFMDWLQLYRAEARRQLEEKP